MAKGKSSKSDEDEFRRTGGKKNLKAVPKNQLPQPLMKLEMKKVKAKKKRAM